MWINPVIALLLKSPLHPMLSASTLLVTWTGRKSGKTYSTPVDYQRQGSQLVSTSSRERTWWRSMRSGSPVTLQLQGKSISAHPRVLDTDAEVAPALATFLENNPRLAGYFHVALDGNQKPRPEDVAKAAAQRVMVYFSLD